MITFWTMNARKLVEAESPKHIMGLMQPLRIFVAVQGDMFCGAHGYPYLPVFSPDPEALRKIYPGAVIIEYIARPVVRPGGATAP